MVDSVFHILVDNHIDGYTLASSPAAVSTLPITNVQKQSRSKIARITSSGGDISITGTAAAVQIADAFAIPRHNLTASHTIRFRTYGDVNQTGTLIYDSGDVAALDSDPAWLGSYHGDSDWADSVYEDASGLAKLFILWTDTITPYRSFQIDIKNVTSGQDFDCSRIYIGRAFKPTYTFAWNWKVEYIDATKNTRSAGGSLRSSQVDSFRRYTITLPNLTDDEREELSAVLESRGMKQDVLVSLNPNATGRFKSELQMICKRVVPSGFTNNYYDNNVISLVFDEA